MDPATFRILDANLNRAREGLRVLEEYARFVLNDRVVSASIKSARHALLEVAEQFGRTHLMTGRDTVRDVGTTITTASESSRADSTEVARAAAARVSEAFRCLEEYGKLVSVDAAKGIEQLRYEHYSIEQDLFAISPRRRRLRKARLHVLLTESLCNKGWLETAEAVLTAGADVIQLREKSLSDSAMRERAKRLRESTQRFGALLIINDRPDIARLVDADAVHLGQDDLSPAAARAIVGPSILIGGSAHDESEIKASLEARVDYIGVGPMFPSGTKPDVTVRGPALLALASRLVTGRGEDAPPTPIVAIGGITEENAASLLEVETGPFAVAICGGIIGDPDPAAATTRLLAALNAEQAPLAARS